MEIEYAKENKKTRVLPHEEAGIYVICSDDALLKNINSILKRRGVIGITDAAGRVHYMIDARKNKETATEKLGSIIVPQGENANVLDSCIAGVFERFGIDMGLTGGMLLYYIVRKLMLDGEAYHSNNKEYFTYASRVFNMSYHTIERDIRYAVSKSSFKSGVRTTRIIKLICDEVKSDLRAASVDE